MAQSKFTLYRYVKLGDGSWRYKRAAFSSNGKIKPNVVIVGKNAQGKPIEETHAEGKYVINHNGAWLDASEDALEAQRRRNALLDAEEFKRLPGTTPVQIPNIVPMTPRQTLSDTVEEFSIETKANKKHKTYLAYKKSTEYFLQYCAEPTVESVDRRDMLNTRMAHLYRNGGGQRRVYREEKNMDSQFQMSPKTVMLHRAIHTGQHPAWKRAVETLLNGKTPATDIQIVEVGLIVSIHLVFGWRDVVFPLSTEKPYERIASYLRETRGVPIAFLLSEDGDIKLMDPNDGEQQVTMFPVGLVFVGQTPSGEWADELEDVSGRVLAKISGEDPETTLKVLEEFASRWAKDRIRKFAANSKV